MEGIIGILIIIAVIIAILWILMPFLIMGTNNRLDKLIGLQEAAQESRGELADTIEKNYQQLKSIRQYARMENERNENN